MCDDDYDYVPVVHSVYSIVYNIKNSIFGGSAHLISLQCFSVTVTDHTLMRWTWLTKPIGRVAASLAQTHIHTHTQDFSLLWSILPYLPPSFLRHPPFYFEYNHLSFFYPDHVQSEKTYKAFMHCRYFMWWLIFLSHLWNIKWLED